MKPTGLPDELRVRDAWTPERQATVWGRVVRAQREQESTRSAGVVLGFFCLAALTAVGFFALVRSRTAIIALAGDEAPDDTAIARGSERLGPPAAPLAGSEGSPAGEGPAPSPGDAADAAPDGTPASAPFHRRLRFRDGSVAILRSPETILEPVSVETRRIVNVLRAGAARFEITKRPGRVFRVIGGDAIVEVLGTKFELERVGSRLRVDVTEGRVRVSWPGGERRLGRGESGVFPPEPTPRRRAPVATRDPLAEPARAEVAGAPPAQATQARIEPVAAGDELGTLLRTADRARASGRALDAAAALRAAIERDPTDSRAPLAEFRLGRLLLEDMGKPGEAAAAFARVRVLAPGGPLAPDALAREIESRAAAGDRATARTLARAYLSRYPNGSHAAWVRRWGATE